MCSPSATTGYGQQGVVAQRLGIAYDEVGDEGGYDAELRLVLQQFDATAALFISVDQATVQVRTGAPTRQVGRRRHLSSACTHSLTGWGQVSRTFDSLASSESNMEECFKHEHERLIAQPPLSDGAR